MTSSISFADIRMGEFVSYRTLAKFAVSIAFFLLCNMADAQPNTWAWMGGNLIGELSPRYGSKGEADTNNWPGAKSGCVSWWDNKGQFWLFSGDPTNTVWRYDGKAWAWIHGARKEYSEPRSVVLGLADTANTPGYRQYSAFCHDGQGNLWMYGGQGVRGVYADLWKWNGAAWTLMAGKDSTHIGAKYGMQGVSGPDNNPGSRWGSSIWMDGANGIWLFGGSTLDGAKNDLWHWDGDNWTWVQGSRFKNATGQYGMRGEADTANNPPPRWAAQAASSGETLYLFGGNVVDSGAIKGPYNDFWKWDGKAWTWLSGSPHRYSHWDFYKDSFQNICGRSGGNLWTDAKGRVWLFGGESGQTPEGKWIYLNDIWSWEGEEWARKFSYHPFSDLPNQGVTAQAGAKGVFGKSFCPGSRRGTAFWIDQQNHFWIYGGLGIDIHEQNSENGLALNDFWQYSMDSSIGFFEPMAHPFILYPNPCSQSFKIEFLDQSESFMVEVLDFNGRVLSEFSLSADVERVQSTFGWSAGVYFIRVKGRKQISYERLEVIK